MKTIYLNKKRSGNYEISNRANATIKFNTIKSLNNWFDNTLLKEKTNQWDKINYCYKNARVVKATYSQTQTYFNSAKELYAFTK